MPTGQFVPGVTRKWPSPTGSNFAGKFAHTLLASDKPLPEMVISVGMPGRSASGEMESMSGAAARVTPAQQDARAGQKYFNHGWTRMNTDDSARNADCFSSSVSIRVHPWFKNSLRLRDHSHGRLTF